MDAKQEITYYVIMKAFPQECEEIGAENLESLILFGHQPPNTGSASLISVGETVAYIIQAIGLVADILSLNDRRRKQKIECITPEDLSKDLETIKIVKSYKIQEEKTIFIVEEIAIIAERKKNL